LTSCASNTAISATMDPRLSFFAMPSAAAVASIITAKASRS